MIGDRMKSLVKAILPGDMQIQVWYRLNRMIRRPRLWQLKPVSTDWGYDRGHPIDRYYIEHFLSAHTKDIHGHVLEFTDASYTQRFGGDRVTKSDVMNVIEGMPHTTIVADLTRADHLPSDQFDCIICTQTLQVIYDVRSALRHLYRMLKPHGVLLVTWQGISKIGRREGVDSWGEYWHATGQAVQRLFQEFFPADSFTLKTYGNVLSAVAFLHGLSNEELRPEELDYVDPSYEVLVTVRAVKPNLASLSKSAP